MVRSEEVMKKILSFFSLFGSLSTLLCCVLPVTLVSIGMGASFAALTSNFPQIIWLVERKNYLFGITAILLMVSYFLMKRSENEACPIDPELGAACREGKNVSHKMFWVSVVVYVVGGFTSYILPLFY